ncbi:MAG TPA: hypothetical protein VF170_15985, partial [Planctomycetaceae bacterium]
EVATIDLPETFTPVTAGKANFFGFLGMTMVIYDAPGGGSLQIAEFRGQAVNDPQAQAQFDRQMRQQGSIYQIDVKESETRTIDIGGESVDVTFATGTEAESGSDWKEVRASFPSKDGLVNLKLQQPAASFDEAQVTEMLESIEVE